MTSSDRDTGASADEDSPLPSPTSIAALVKQADDALEQLLHEADSRPDHAVAEDFAGTRVADIFAHLTGWHDLFVQWVETDARKATPAFPAPGYEWEQLAELNRALLDQRQHHSYDDLRAALVDSHARVTAVVRSQSEDVLFDRSAHAWLGDESLGAVAHECLANHYRWGIAMLGECAAP